MFELTQEIKDLGVSKVVMTNDSLYVYNGKSFSQSNYDKNALDVTFNELTTQMISDKHFGDENTVKKIVKLLCDLYANSVIEKAKNKETKKLKVEYSQVYRSTSILGEAILINDTPKWLVTSSTSPQHMHIQDTIEVSDTKAIKPYESTSYTNRAYIFNSTEHLNETIERAKKETFDTLYAKVENIWHKYIAEGTNHISICAADTIFSFFQDKIGLTHYLFFIADNDAGKTNNLHVLNFLAYRNMMSTDMTPANIYSYLGCKYEGLGTICEDEADDLDESREKMRLNKSGYTTGIKVYRTDTNTSEGRKQDAYYTFCFKAFAAERLPDSFKAKGFKQRIVELACTPGTPNYDISEIVNPSGDEIDQELLDELNEVRNTLLIYRLLHYYDKIPNIKLNITNREKQLFKPILRVFQDTQTFTKLLPVISDFVNQRRDEKSSTITAFLYRLISDLIELNNNDPKLESSAIWLAFQDENDNPGELKSKYTYDSVAFGEISQKTLVQILKDQFSATRPKHTGNTKQLIFDVTKLQAIGSKYKSDINVRLESDESDESGYGLDKHLYKQDSTSKSTSKTPQNIDTMVSNNATQATQATQTEVKSTA